MHVYTLCIYSNLLLLFAVLRASVCGRRHRRHRLYSFKSHDLNTITVELH